MRRRKTEPDKRKSSSTAGKIKGPNCQKSVAKNFVTLDTKGYKKNWSLWMQGCMEITKANNMATQEIIEQRKTS